MARFRVVADGDSWFSLPKFRVKLPTVGGTGFDLVRALEARGTFEVISVAYWGDTIHEIAKRADYMNAILGEQLQGRQVDALLLSGGGNDLLGEGGLSRVLKVPSVAGKSAADYVKTDALGRILRRAIEDYGIILANARANPKTATLPIFVHGYDYAKPMKLIWLEDPMDAVGVPNMDVKRDIVRVVMDAFNARPM
jgi:hypothetical protein